MTPEERERRIVAWYDDLAATALGRLYWSEEQLLTSDVNAILVGGAAHLEMLRGIFGGPAKSGSGARRPGRGKEPPKLTPEAFDTLFGASPTRRRQ